MKDKTIEPLPHLFQTEERLELFWDEHSKLDYQQYLKPSDDTIDSKRVLEV